MAASIEDSFTVACEKFNVDNLQTFQENTVKSLLKGQDVYLSVKTGSGKSLCYQMFSTLWRLQNELENGNTCQVVIVSPLISIMREQCEYLTNLGLEATYIGKDESEQSRILAGDYEYVFTSPESLLGIPVWRDMLSNDRTKLLVVDEAHTVLHCMVR